MQDHAESETEGFIHTDITRDVLASLELFADAVTRAEVEPAWWKWAVISAHMASNTALVGYLTGTSSVGALDEKSTKALLEWYDQRTDGREMPRERLAEFPTLMSRALAGECGFHGGEPPIDISNQEANLRKLNSLRSQFVHFRDVGWMIEINYLRPILKSALTLISSIDRHGWAFRHGSLSVRQRIRALISALERRLSD